MCDKHHNGAPVTRRSNTTKRGAHDHNPMRVSIGEKGGVNDIIIQARNITYVSKFIPSPSEPLIVQKIAAVRASRDVSKCDGAHTQQGDAQHLRTQQQHGEDIGSQCRTPKSHLKQRLSE